MVRDTRLSCLKMPEEESASKHRTRKVDSQNALETSGRKVPESLTRGSERAERVGSSRCYINSEKYANEFSTKNMKEDLRIGSSSTCDKANKRRSESMMEKNEDGRRVSSSNENSIRSSSPATKLRKMNDESRTSGANDSKSEHSGKKTIRKHLHVRAFKKLLAKQAKTGGNHGGNDKCIKEKAIPQGLSMDLGVNTSKEVKERGDVRSSMEGVQDERERCVETIESLKKKESKKTKLLATFFDASSTPDVINQEHKTKFSGSKCGRRIPKLKSDNLLDPSGEETYNHDPCELNMESPPSMLQEFGVGDNGVCNSEFLGTPDQQIAEENVFVVPKDFTSTQTIIAPMHPACLVCKQPGRLICCCGKGCKRSYHLSCFNPLLHDVPPGAWLCNFCVRKKMELGVYSVSVGIESVWDVDEGMQSGKRYFVKFKDLAHVHNRWIPESELLQDDPSLLANFEKKVQKEAPKWRKEWTEPERLLQKRLVAPLEVADEYTSVSVSESLNCCIEWFVKWKGLEYDQATWELENLLLLRSSEAPRLIKDYECRREHASRSYDPLRADKALQVKKDPFCKLSKLPDECLVEHDNDHLSYVNCLREFWYKSLNAVFIDGQERISKSILFVLSLQSHACRPSLIITTSGSLQLWQVNFLRLAPSVNVIMYQGDKDARKMIRSLEFYEESGRLMVQVLLADLKAVVEDLADIACIGWESIIVDECQNSKTTRYLEQLNILNTDFKLLIFNGQPKDNVSEYRVLLSFLNTGGTMDNGLVGPKATGNDTLGPLTKLKEKLARHIAFQCNTDSFKFDEYWVPVPLSSVQLEQYCATLLSNATVLRSNSKSDVVGALHNILITARKCCNHPYLVDGELRGLLTKGLQPAEFLNAEVCASGKLFLLGKILQDMKDRELRVVILFQSLGPSGKVSLGDILDDFLRLRFGVDTYERIETGLVMAKKVDALKKFNDKETGRFVFLIEKSACLASIKLRSVDVIILFNSDWNPLNDLRSLKKLSIESQHDCIRVFRFYTSYTVEEKLLMLSKQDVILESRVENITRNVTHLLLGWGTSYLFRKLDQLHSSASPACISEPSFEKLCLNDVILEILTQLPGKTETSSTAPCSILMKVRLSGGTYSRNSVLVGEKEGISLPDEDLPSFWSELLEGRHPKWIYRSEQSQRIRRRIQNANGLVIQAVEGDEGKSKRQKMNNIVHPLTLPKFSQEKGNAPKEIQQSCMLESEGEKQKLEDQRNLVMLLEPELSELCDILELPESVKGMAQEFLVYIMNNHDVSTNQVTVLQSLKISLCWRAASMSRHSLDHGVSLSLAKKYLKFECTEEEAYSVYSKLRILKEKFPCQSGALENLSVQNILDNQSSLSKTEDDVRETLDGRAKEIVSTDNLTLGVTNGFPIDYKTSEQLISQQGRYPIGETPGKFQLDIASSKDNLFKNQIDLIEEVFLTRSEDLVQKQKAEVSIFKKQMYKDRLKLEKTCDIDVELIRTIHIDATVRKGKINVLAQELSAKLGRFDQHRKQQKKKLMSMQLDMRYKEEELKSSWLEKAKTGKMDESLYDIPRLESRFRLEEFMEASEFAGNCNNSGGTILNSACHSVETNTGSERCLEVPSNILNEREENVRLGDVALTSSTSVVLDNLEHIVQNRISVEPALLPELPGVLPMDSGISASNFKQQEGRNDSNGLHLMPNQELNQGALLSSVQGLASYASASTSSSIQELRTIEHTSPAGALSSSNSQDLDSSHQVTVPVSDSIVTLSPHIELMRCNDVASSNSTDCQLYLAEHEQERLTPSGYQVTQSHPSVEQSEVPAQQEAIAVVVESELFNCHISENVVYPLRPLEYLPSEGIPSEHLRSTLVQHSVACDRSHSSTQQAEVPVQNAIEAAVFESEPSIQQMPENNLHPMRPQEDLRLERTHLEHLISTSIQPDEPNQLFQNFPSIEWVPAQAHSADPMRNELLRVLRQDCSCTKRYENKKLLLQSECEQEIEKVRRKYDILLQDAERAYLHDKNMFVNIYQKICLHKFFADEVRSNFYDQKEGSSTSFQAPSQNASQHLQASRPQPQVASRPSSTSLPVPLSTASWLHPSQTTNQASTAPFLPITRPQTSVPAVTSIHSTGLSNHTPPFISSNIVRGPITPRQHLLISRSPAPHLQRIRPVHASDPTTNTPLTPVASLQPAPPSLVSTATPSVPPLDFGSTFSAPCPVMESFISNACGISQPTVYGSSPLHFIAPQFVLPQYDGDDNLLESLLANLPANGVEFSTESMIDSRYNASTDVIMLSDEDDCCGER